MQRVWSTYLDSFSRESVIDDSLTYIPQRSLKRPDFIASNAYSTHFQDTAAQDSLMGMHFNNNSIVSSSDFPILEKSTIQFSEDDDSLTSSTDLSLSVNYLPSKFSDFRNRKTRKYDDDDDPALPETGGGLVAFRANVARTFQWKKGLRWNRFKWALIGTNTLLTLYSMIASIICLLTWFDVWEKADVIRLGNAPELTVSTLAALIAMLTSLIGWAGILLNNRGFLAWYTFLTWITFAFLVAPGYITYKRRTFDLEGKINAQWSRNLNTADRLRVQNQLNCCGYFSPYVEATVSQTCYARSLLPGCKGPYLAFQTLLLKHWFKAVFGLVPVQLLVMVAGLLCSNHVTHKFGKGMMPEAYQLNVNTMAVILHNYSNQLAEHYGVDITSTVFKHSRSKLTLSTRIPSYYLPRDDPDGSFCHAS